jgi:tetratricopeptide (TPR) repeat protein
VRVFLILAALAIATPLAAGGRAAAQRREQATAEVLFERALTAMQAGDYAAACPLLEESEALDHGIGTTLYLAECYERVGRTASAWAAFRRAASLASAAGQDERARAASERAARLDLQLSTLTLAVDAPSPELALACDGVALPRSAWGVPVPVDPGEHVIEAVAPRHTPLRALVPVRGAGAAVLYRVPALAIALAEPSAPALAGPAAPTAPPPRTPPSRRRAWLWTSAAALALGGALTLGLTLRPAARADAQGYGGSTGDHLGGP